jgi:hypothetical protein
MRRLFFFETILIFAFCINMKAQDPCQIPEAVIKSYNQINVGVFPQVELISIVQTISKYPTFFGFLMAQDTFKYKTEVIDHFGPYKEHPAVRMFNRLSSQPGMLNFSAPSNIMLYTDKSLNLRSDIKLDDFVINRSGGMDSLKVLLNLLRDFASESSFNEFFLGHRDFYLTIVEHTVSNLGSTNFINEVESFYGKNQRSYNIGLVSLYHYVGFGNSLLCSNDTREIYNIMGPQKTTNNEPCFGDENYMKYLIRHEFSHPFINPMTEKKWDYIKGYSYKYDSIPEVARKYVCGDWQECINEFIIRAITTQLVFNESNELGLQAYKKETSRGESYLDALLEKIRLYQSMRDKYPTFESFYLNILDVFKE